MVEVGSSGVSHGEVHDIILSVPIWIMVHKNSLFFMLAWRRISQKLTFLEANHSSDSMNISSEYYVSNSGFLS